MLGVFRQAPSFTELSPAGSPDPFFQSGGQNPAVAINGYLRLANVVLVGQASGPISSASAGELNVALVEIRLGSGGSFSTTAALGKFESRSAASGRCRGRRNRFAAAGRRGVVAKAA